MARIFGTIESLKSLKSELQRHGITRFNSVKEIKDFILNYHSEKRNVLYSHADKIEKEYAERYANLKLNEQKKAEIITLESEKINNRISDLQLKINSNRTKDGNFLKKLISSMKVYILVKQSTYYVENKNELLRSSVKEITQNIKNDEVFIKEYLTDRQNLIEVRTKPEMAQLERTHHVLEKLQNLISGAIGENLVVKEIQKLSDDYALINDFKLRFARPIFYKKQKQKIYSVQIDHLLISKAGIFIIETKNWSKTAVCNSSLRSPIEQIERANFALYVYISENITLNEHHWGKQRIPIRNLIVMIRNKPTAEFKYVSVKLLSELTNYISYFDPILTEKQVDSVTKQLTTSYKTTAW